LIDIGYNLLMAIKMITVFLLIYIFIPSQIIRFGKENSGFLDKFFISLTHSTILTIIIVHILALLKLYETFSLIFCFFLWYILLAWYRGKSPMAVADAMGMKLIVNLLDMSEGRSGFGNEVKNFFSTWFGKFRGDTVRIIRKFLTEPFTGLLPVGVLAASAYIRFNHSINHAAFSVSDTYGHLAWVKFLGGNQIYHDGIYSHGYHAVISAMAKLLFIDPYWLIRFTGPLGGVLLVLSVYYFALRITRSYVASLIAMVVYGLVTSPDFPSLVARQTAAMPQEYSAVFMLPGIYFLWLYYRYGNMNYLLLHAEVLAITIMVHPFGTVYYVIWSAVLSATVLLFKIAGPGKIVRMAVIDFFSGVISLAPFGIALLLGKEFFKASAEYIIGQGAIAGNNSIITMESIIGKIFTNNAFIDVTVPVVMILIISLPLIKERNWSALSVTVSCCSVIMYLFYRALDFNLPKLMDPPRTGVFLTPMYSVLYASGFYAIERAIRGLQASWLLKLKVVFIHILSLVVCLSVVFFYPPALTKAELCEYDAAAENYLVIKNKYPVLDWTIVGPAEQFEQVVGIGWHYDILRFVQRFNLEQAMDPDFDIPIPTHHIFFYTEKRPLNFGREVTSADAEKDLDPEGDDPFLQYYRTSGQRAILEAKAIRWVEAYSRSHRDVTVFYEDDNLKIYHIYNKLKNDTSNDSGVNR